MAHMRSLIHPTDHAVSEDWFSGDAKCLRVCECARVYPLAMLYLPITVHVYRESKQFCASVEAPIFDNLLKWKDWMAVLLFMVAFSQLCALSWGGLSTLAAGAGGEETTAYQTHIKGKEQMSRVSEFRVRACKAKKR